MTLLAHDNNSTCLVNCRETGSGPKREELDQPPSLRSRNTSGIRKKGRNKTSFLNDIKINCATFNDKMNLSFFQSSDMSK